MHEQGGPGSQERDQMLEGPRPRRERPWRVRTACPEGVTELPLISAVRLLLQSPSFLLLYPGQSSAHGGCSSSACRVKAARGQCGAGHWESRGHPPTPPLMLSRGSGKSLAAEPESQQGVTDHSVGS